MIRQLNAKIMAHFLDLNFNSSLHRKVVYPPGNSHTYSEKEDFSLRQKLKERDDTIKATP